jgi:hypothetical protein
MRANFTVRDSVPERLVCEGEIVFEEGVDSDVLAGMKLVGFSLWRSPDGEVYVTFPSRAFGAGSERRFFDYLRTADPEAASQTAGPKRVKDWLIAAWEAQGKPQAPVAS